MEMSKGEIVASYRQAADLKKQIGILAELNACEKRDIVEILREAGEPVPGNFGPRKKPVETPEAAMQQPETPEEPDLGNPLAGSKRSKQQNATERFALEDVLAIIFDALDDYTEAPAENEVRSEAAFIGYLIGIKDAYTALRGPIVR